MPDPVDFWAPRTCLLAATPIHEVAADLLFMAVDALCAGDSPTAVRLVQLADLPELHEHGRRVFSEEPAIQRWRPVSSCVSPPSERLKQRAPNAQTERQMYERDRWRCRYCGCRVLLKPALHRLRALLPGVINWPRGVTFDSHGKKIKNHGAFYALNACAEHVVPHSGGGTNDLENLVTSCWPCNFGKAHYTLEECGLLDPRSRPPIAGGHWDGLARVLKVAKPSQRPETDRQVSEMVTPTAELATHAKAAAKGLSRQDLIDGVRAYGRKNYHRNGWHIVVDSWSDSDIDSVIGIRTKSVLGAVQMMVQTGGFKQQAMLAVTAA